MEGASGLRRDIKRTEHEVARSDRRWLLIVASIFVCSIVLLIGVRQVYRATGPHPQVTAFIQDVKRVAKQFIPRVRRPRKAETL